jgi:transcriptional regulator GlxA family with amidase domain
MTRHRLVVLLFDQVLPLDFAIPMQVFAYEAADFYDVHTASVAGNEVAFAGGSHLTPDGGIELLDEADTIIVPGFSGAATAIVDESALQGLRDASGRGARIASICSGAFALAQAGLLDGLTVTTHWSLGEELARGFPRVTVDAAALFIDSETVLTSGGVMAGVDLALHILRKDLGASVSNTMARRIVMAPRPDGSQGQFSEVPPLRSDDDTLSQVQRWMIAELAEPITVAEMAARANLSARQFHRRFLELNGKTPLAWLHDQRIGQAKELLETTNRPIDDIARRVGLGTAANFRVHFRRATGISPSAYRQAFWGSTLLGVA